MKLSLCSANYGKTDLKKIIYRTAELGFDGIELTVMFHVPPTTGASARAEIKKWLKDAGIECSALHYIFDKSVKLNSTYGEDMKHSIEHLKSVIDLASDLEAPTIIVGGGGTRSIKADQKKEEVIESMVTVFRAAGEYAAEKSVVLAMEALNRYETNFIKTLGDAAEFAEKVDLPSVRIMGDTYHMNIEEITIEDAIIQYGNRLAHLHLADSNRLAPGEGHIDFKKVLDALDRIDFAGYGSFEVFCISPDLMYFDTYEEADRHMVNGARLIKSLRS